MAVAQMIRDPLEVHSLLIGIFAHGYTVPNHFLIFFIFS